MAKKLKVTVTATGPDGVTSLFKPGDKLPAWVAKAVPNPDVWEDVKEEETVEDEEPEKAPPAKTTTPTK